MKQLRRWIAPLVVVLVAGCATFSPPKTPQEAINQANLVITAIAQQVGDNLTNKVMTHDEAAAAIAKLRPLAAGIDEAQALLANGQAMAAGDKAKIVNQLLLSLQREVAAKAREAQQ